MNFDPAPLFAASLIPYLLFLHWLRKSEALPLMAERGFQLTLLFVAVTIGAAIAPCAAAQRNWWRLTGCTVGQKPFSPSATRFW